MPHPPSRHGPRFTAPLHVCRSLPDARGWDVAHGLAIVCSRGCAQPQEGDRHGGHEPALQPNPHARGVSAVHGVDDGAGQPADQLVAGEDGLYEGWGRDHGWLLVVESSAMHSGESKPRCRAPYSGGAALWSPWHGDPREPGGLHASPGPTCGAPIHTPCGSRPSRPRAHPASTLGAAPALPPPGSCPACRARVHRPCRPRSPGWARVGAPRRRAAAPLSPARAAARGRRSSLGRQGARTP